MKTTASIVLAIAFIFNGCATFEQYLPPSTTRTIAKSACINAINFAAKTQADRIEAARYIWGISNAVYTYGSGHILTPAELEALIKLWTPSGSKWAALASDLSGAWAVIYPHIRGNNTLAFEYLQALSGGCADAAATFIPPKP